MLLKREIHWIFNVFDRSRTKALSSTADDRAKDGAGGLARVRGFGAAPQTPAQSAGFGRRKTPIPETTDGRAPSSVANDRGTQEPAPRGALGGYQPFSLQSADDTARAHAVPLAADEMASQLLAWLSSELRSGRQVQHEAVLCALGALSGYAAQQAIHEDVVKPGKLSLDEAFVLIETRAGGTFFFGDLLNGIIVSKDPAQLSIWKIVSDAGRQAGAVNLPDITDIIKHSAASVGGPEFGVPRLSPVHMPPILPREAVNRFWPAARRRLAGTPPTSWPLHLAMAAHKLIIEQKDALRPDIAVRIVMESAVPMSKIDPLTVPKA
jgi:hypothetical protein